MTILEKATRETYFLEPKEKFSDKTDVRGHRIKYWGKKQWKSIDLYELLHV